MPKILGKTIPYFRVGSAVCCYFCIWDLKRASDPVYKKNLYEKRKEAYSQSLCRPITEKLLKPLVEKYGSLDILKHPMQGMVLVPQKIGHKLWSMIQYDSYVTITVKNSLLG